MALPPSPLVGRARPGREYVSLKVARLVSGVDLRLGLHIVTGENDGPTLGIVTTIHGDETMALMAVRELLNSIDPRSLSGRVAAIPVANPLAVMVFGRQTPEQHGRTDLHETFPGNETGNLTQRIACTITTNLLDHVNALIDIHCGGLGGRLQRRVDLDASASVDVYNRSLKLCRAFNSPFVHMNNLAGTAARYCNNRGIPTANPEIGGVYLGPHTENTFMGEIISGLRAVMSALKMIPAVSMPRKRQLFFGVKSRVEVNPSVGGFLRSSFCEPTHLGSKVQRGTKLGEIIDIHSFEVAEELWAPVTGYLFFSRYSGVVDAGMKAFALAEETSSEWLSTEGE
jgi:predicted deacylase